MSQLCASCPTISTSWFYSNLHLKPLPRRSKYYTNNSNGSSNSCRQEQNLYNEAYASQGVELKSNYDLKSIRINLRMATNDLPNLDA